MIVQLDYNIIVIKVLYAILFCNIEHTICASNV